MTDIAGTDKAVCDRVLAVARKVLAEFGPKVRDALQDALKAEGLTMGVEAGMHSGLDVWCPAFGRTDDPGVFASLALGGPERAQRAVKMLAEPRHRMVIAAVVAETLWDEK